MSTDRRETFREIVSGESHVPYLVSAWQHLVGHEYGAEEFAQAYVDFVKAWDWEWVKINPRAIYYAEAWGAQYDRNDYAGFVIPKRIKAGITKAEDLSAITRLDPEQSAPLAEALESSRLIRAGLEDRAVLQSVFSPLSVLLQIADLPLYPGDDYARPEISREELIFDHPAEAKAALDNIARTLAEYARLLVTPVDQGGAGLDGIFYAVTGTVSDDYFDYAQYQEFSQPYDQIVIDAVRETSPDAVVLLHTCRQRSHPEWFVDSGAQVLQWDQYLEGNPYIDALDATTPVGGASYQEFAPGHDAQELRSELKETIAQREGKPFLLAPSCTVPTPADNAQLEVLSRMRVAD